MWRKKFQRDYGFGGDTSFYFGINDGKDFEHWNKGITLLDEWTYFDDGEKKMGWMNLLGKSKKMRKMQWTVYYQLK
jgi:hypothetical protein